MSRVTQPRFVANCGACGVRFECRPDRPQRYCSRQCVAIGRRTIEARACVVCSQLFLPTATTSRQQFCSQRCRGAGVTRGLAKPSFPIVEKVSITCEQCSLVFWLKPCHVVNVSNGSPRR